METAFIFPEQEMFQKPNNHIDQFAKNMFFSFSWIVMKLETKTCHVVEVLVLLRYNEGHRCASDYEWLCSILRKERVCTTANIMIIIE